MKRLLQRARSERGAALVLTLAVMFVSGMTLVSVIQYTSATGRDSSLGRARNVAYSGAEAGINNALAILGNAVAPTTGTLLPERTVVYENATVKYSGVFDGGTKVWTITSVATVPNPTGGAVISRTLTRKVQVTDATAGPTVTGWSRYYDDDIGSCVEVKNTLPGPFATRGNLCMKGTGKITGSNVWVGGNVTLEASTSIGTSATPITAVDIAGTCKYTTQTANKPCSAVDRVYAGSYATVNASISKPTVDFTYWYNNAKPGPKHPCTAGVSSGTPPTFDGNATYDGSVTGEQEITPQSASYVCKVVVSGQTVGELSWNHVTKVLTVKGTIFIDGNVVFKDDDQLVNYNGRATLYASRKMHFDEVVCAGGTGTTNCRTAGMSTWDPTANLLVLAMGDKEGSGTVLDMHKQAAFQGIIWAHRDCQIDDNARSSGPVICNKLKFNVKESETGGFYAWPPLGTLLEGQTYGTTPAPGDYAILAGDQSG